MNPTTPNTANTGPDAAAPRLSTPLRWALALALLGTALVSWLPEEEVAPPSARGKLAGRPAVGTASDTRPRAGALPWPAGPAARDDQPLPQVAALAAAAWAEGGSTRSGAERGSAAATAAATAASAPTSLLPAPPPYQLIGLLDEDGRVRALLQAGPRTLVVAEGDTLDAGWTVERVAERSVTLRAADGDTRHTLKFKPA